MGMNDGLLAPVSFFSWRTSSGISSTLGMFPALVGHEGPGDLEPELVLSLHLMLGEQSLGWFYMKSRPREHWQSGILAW